jgi:ubiquinone/menaquinone biosynthesis C-methylase UbiE
MSQETKDKPVSVLDHTAGWRRQFSQPRGWLGSLVGFILAIRNKKRSLWVLSLLDLRPAHRVLEIGFGPGMDIRRVASRVSEGLVAGIDHSEVMVRQACRRNAEAINAGRVELRQGTASQLPFDSDSFDTVFAINVAQFWPEPANIVRELRRVLKPGGQLALAVQPRNKDATEATARDTGKKLVGALISARFASVRLEQQPAKPVSIVYALGTK